MLIDPTVQYMTLICKWIFGCVGFHQYLIISNVCFPLNFCAPGYGRFTWFSLLKLFIFFPITIAFSDMQLANEFFDTEEIQRLWDLKQLGQYSSHTWEPILEYWHTMLLGVSEFQMESHILYSFILVKKV
jgi:hypothetical protein